jgi:DNA modification methylase
MIEPYYSTQLGELYCGNVIKVLRELPDEIVQCVITSPPYWGMRDYGIEGQIGLEKTPQKYIEKLVTVFSEIRRVLKNDGTMWIVIGDCYIGSWGNYGPGSFGGQREKHTERWTRGAYDGHKEWRPPTSYKQAGLKKKDLAGIPWSVALALREDGWYLRCDIIWYKPNAMPGSAKDRPSNAHDYIFLMSKKSKYYYDAESIREKQTGKAHSRGKGLTPKTQPDTQRRIKAKASFHRGTSKYHKSQNGLRNKRSVWTVPTRPLSEPHYAAYPPDLIVPCIKAGSGPGATVLDPFIGSGTTAEVCEQYGRRWIGIELSEEYCEIARKRIDKEAAQLKLELT